MMSQLAGLVTGTALGVAMALAVTSSPAQAMQYTPPPCAMEDSPGPCYWDAAKRGNGKGMSFYADSEGNVYYI